MTSNERLELSWRTYTLNKGFIGPEIYQVVKDAYTAAWYAGVAEPRSSVETTAPLALLQAAWNKYGRHLHDCQRYGEHQCTCGFVETCIALRSSVEPAPELSASEAASFDKTLARSPRRVETSERPLTNCRHCDNGTTVTADGFHRISVRCTEYPNEGSSEKATTEPLWLTKEQMREVTRLVNPAITNTQFEAIWAEGILARYIRKMGKPMETE